jgi:excinuclease ABC subunit A
MIGKWTAVTGVSGSGKTSLAFDTLFSEAQRRFLETLGTYERQFLAGIPQGEFDSLDPIPPAIALKQSNRSADPRSVIGTSADVIYPLRTLFAALMSEGCATCGSPVMRDSPEKLLSAIAANPADYAICVKIDLHVPAEPTAQKPEPKTKPKSKTPAAQGRLLAPSSPRTSASSSLIAALKIEGYTKARVGNKFVALEEIKEPGESLEIVLDMFGRDETSDDLKDRVQSIWDQINLSDRFGTALLYGMDSADNSKSGSAKESNKHEPVPYRVKPWCQSCATETKCVTAGDLDWQSTLGCCPTCNGLGNVPVIDHDKVIPDPSLSLRTGAIKPWAGTSYTATQKDFLKSCKSLGIPVDIPYESMTEQHKKLIWNGPLSSDFPSINEFFGWLEKERYKQSSRILLAKYRKYKTCPDCAGARVGAAGRNAIALGSSYDDIFNGEIRSLQNWISLASKEIKSRNLGALFEIQRELSDKIDLLVDLGLGSSALSRRSKSLSGGEYQRVLLCRVIGNGLSDALYVLDEPSIGLGPSEIPALIIALQRLRDMGNTVVMVEHEPSLVRAADNWIELGPEGGSKGGYCTGTGTFTGTFKGAEEPASLNASSERIRVPSRKKADTHATALKPQDAIVLRGFSHLNCDNLLLEIPLGKLTVIAGPSGAGKTTLLRAGLDQALQQFFETKRTTSRSSDIDEQKGCWEAIELPAALQQSGELIAVDQRAAYRSIASVPATMLGVMDDLRKLFANTMEANELGLGPSDFSFNGAGACPACEGRGATKDNLFFLGEIEKTCDACQGQRYRSEVLSVRFRGKNIAQWLATSMSECLAESLFGRPQGGIRQPARESLELCQRLGLGHLPLGIPSSQISGGEAQRLRIAAALSKRSARLICLIDEPSRGLSEQDVANLIEAFQDLCQSGHTIVVVEHHSRFQQAADQLVIMGPGAGSEGGQICERSLAMR